MPDELNKIEPDEEVEYKEPFFKDRGWPSITTGDTFKLKGIVFVVESTDDRGLFAIPFVDAEVK